MPPSSSFIQPAPLPAFSLTQGYRQDFSVRSILPSQNGWRIEAGFVRTVSYLEDGTIVPLSIWGTGDIVGLPTVGAGAQQSECLTKVCATPAQITSDQQMQKILLAHLQQAQELMIIRSHRRIEPMLIKLLGWLAQRFGRSIDRGQLLELRLTHQDIAELLGSTRVTVTRSLQQLEQQGLIERLSLRQILLHEWETWHYEI